MSKWYQLPSVSAWAQTQEGLSPKHMFINTINIETFYSNIIHPETRVRKKPLLFINAKFL